MNNIVNYGSGNLNLFDCEINNDFFSCRVFWARIISSETESLFTQNTKHTFYEIQYALEGRIGMAIGEGEHILFDQSDFIIIPPDTYHQIVDGDTEGKRFIMAFNFFPLDASLKNVMNGLSSLVPHRETMFMRKILSIMMKKNFSNSSLDKCQLNTLIECFLLEIIDSLSEASLFSKKALGSLDCKNATVAEIKSFIHSYNGVGISVEFLAKRFNISQRHLNRIFLSETGKSPKEAINYEKLRYIEALVTTTSLSLSEISALCNFSDEYAMNKFFKRYTLTNLSDFRSIAKK